jgi:hypothetical protein
MISRISQSMLAAWGMCPHKFCERYLKKRWMPFGPAAAMGTSFHAAAKVNSKQKAKTHVDLPLDDLKDAARDKWYEEAKGGLYIPKDDLPEKPRILKYSFNDALRSVEMYHAEIAPRVQPVFAEEKFHESFGYPFPVVFVVDYIDQDGKIGDWKCSGKAPAKDDARNSLQGVFYAMGYEAHFGKPPTDFEQYWLVTRRNNDGKRTSEEWYHQSYLPTQSDYAGLHARIQSFLAALKAGNFPPAYRGAWWCSAKSCEFFPTCIYVGNPESKVMI